VIRSTNLGKSWGAADSGLSNVYALAVKDTFVFAGTNQGLFVSSVNSNRWQDASSRLPGKYVRCFAVLGKTLVAGTLDGGVFCSSDNGTSWHSVNTGLANSATYSLAIGTTHLFAGTGGDGVWERPLSEMIASVDESRPAVPFFVQLCQNYPNPFNPTTTIRYALPQRSHVTLTVFNALGQLVATLVNDEEQAGAHEAKFDGLNLASGIYFYRLSAGSFVRTMECLLIK